ncbi:MAG: FeoB small GTPase domain-containing protein [Chloroflexota bacterium]|nr:FeoB small GTPase domain-containing protein [Chloroflexota bacterium]
MAKELTIALAGNPNSGKSTVFNALTGARQHVGNWPGKTVARKEGICKYDDHVINVIDLPGTYSLTAYSMEEVIARGFVVEGKPDVVVDIVDASNLERNLYLALQILELEANLVIDLNMTDMAEARGHEIDVKALSDLLGVPVVPTVANKGQGIEELLAAIVEAAGV